MNKWVKISNLYCVEREEAGNKDINVGIFAFLEFV